MIRNIRRVSCHLLAIFIIGCLLYSPAVTAYAGELPASHPSCVTCKGTLSPLGRWCDNKNGTVTDMSTGMVWLKDASWGGIYYFYTTLMTTPNAADRAAQVKNGNPASLTDGSQEGDWGLPTLAQLTSITVGTEAVYSTDNYSLNTYFLTGVHIAAYWTNTTRSSDAGTAWSVFMFQSGVGWYSKTTANYVWPVRNGK
ncbi:MAG: DUF1566 domain-containing protein [Deltaproteobacteria bacterium]|nr:DUF1566 domain-containing protein [Deltaproteobacteria bacterium]